MIPAMISVPILVALTLVLVHRLVDQGARYNRDSLELSEEIYNLKKTIDLKKDKLAKLTKQNIELIYAREQLEKDLNTTQTLAKGYLDDLEDANRTISEQEKKLSILADHKNDLENFIKQQDQIINDHTKLAFNLECKADIHKKREEASIGENTKLKTTITTLEETIATKDKEIADLKARLKNRQSLFNKQFKELTEKTEYAEALKEENRNLRHALELAEDKLDAIIHNADWKVRHKWLWDYAISYMRRLHIPELRIDEFSQKVKAQQFGELTLVPTPEPDKLDLIDQVMSN